MKRNARRLSSVIALIAVSLLATWGRMTGGAAANLSAAVPVSSREDTLAQLLNARYQSATRLLEAEEIRLNDGRSTLMSVCDAARRVRDSAIELPTGPEERVQAF